MRLTRCLPLLLAGLSLATFPIETRDNATLSARTLLNLPVAPWPRKTIMICTEGGPNPQFFTLVQEAWRLWQNAIGGEARSGLKLQIPYNKADGSVGGCETDKRVQFLHVTLNTERRAVTTVGES